MDAGRILGLTVCAGLLLCIPALYLYTRYEKHKEGKK